MATIFLRRLINKNCLLLTTDVKQVFLINVFGYKSKASQVKRAIGLPKNVAG